MDDVIVFENLIDSETGQPITVIVPEADPVQLKTRALQHDALVALGKQYAKTLNGMCDEE